MSLVEALSSWPELQTIESCEGDKNTPAFVCFRYGRDDPDRPWQDVAEFVLDFLAPELLLRIGDGASIAVRCSDAGSVVADLWVRPGALDVALQALRELYVIGDPVRTSLCSGDTSDTCGRYIQGLTAPTR